MASVDHGPPHVRRMRELAAEVRDEATGLRVLFVTNLRAEDLADLGPDGVINTAQYYTQDEADQMIRGLQELGVTVNAYFDERDFIAAALAEDWPADGKQPIVFTTAEGGTGAGRRALIPALCNLLDLPVVNSGAHASTIARHKFHANAVLRRAGVRAPATWQFRQGMWIGPRPPLGARVIVKPTYETMCIGIGADSVRFVEEDFDAFVTDSYGRFGQSVLVQEFVSGEEVGVPVLRIDATHALPALAFRRAGGEPFGDRPRTFEDENLRGDLSIAPFFGTGVAPGLLERAATLAFDALEMEGAGRIDFRIDADGRAWVFDTSECPPPLEGGSFARSLERLGFSYQEMLAIWLGASLLDAGRLRSPTKS